MASYTLDIKETLYVTDCPNCHVLHGIPQAMERRLRETGGSAYCPNGHTWYFTETEVDKARREAEAQRKDAALAWQRFRDERAAHDQEKRSHAATKGQLTKMRNRIAAGMCPYCRRSITELREHVGEKHPDKATEFAKLAAEARRT